MKIIVLRKVNYQEKDTIIDAISEKGPITFKVRGGQNPNSAFVWMNNPLTVADVEFVENPRYTHRILKAAAFEDTMLTTGDYGQILTVSLISEITLRMLQEEEQHNMFDLILKFISVYKNKKENLLGLLMLMAKAIKFAGGELEVNHCVFCGSKKEIINFSFAEGGYICRNCMREAYSTDLTKNDEMQLMRALFVRDLTDDLPEDTVPLELKEKLLIKLTQYIKDGIGVTLDTPKLIIDNLRK